MTDQTTADLIAEAKAIGNWGRHVSGPDGNGVAGPTLFARVVAALEAAEQRAEEAEKSRGEWAFRAGDRDALEDQRNQLAAVVEKVRKWAGEPLLQSPAGYGLNRILVAAEVAPADVLREVKAAAWDEGYSHCFDFEAEDGGVSLLDNPYRAREEAGQ